MCWVLYLGSDVPLTRVEWDERRPAFNVQVCPETELSVARQFTKRHVYAVGSHTFCGCGFDRGQANPDQPDELAMTEGSLGRLQQYLREAVALAGELELYACWDGDQAAEPDHRWALTPDDVNPMMSWFPDRTYATVTRK